MARTIVSGGGYNSRVVTHKSALKSEPVSKAANVAGVAQQGMATAFKKEPLIQGKGYEPARMGPTGIANATKGQAGAGPGGYGRTIYRSGSQGPTPAAREMFPSRDYFDERPNKGNRP
jgi:hypothetical protein